MEHMFVSKWHLWPSIKARLMLFEKKKEKKNQLRKITSGIIDLLIIIIMVSTKYSKNSYPTRMFCEVQV